MNEKSKVSYLPQACSNGLAFFVGVCIGAYDDGTKCIGVMVDTLTPEIEKKIPKTLEGHPVRIDESGVFKPLK